jgi:hypothetical protein
MGAEVGIQPMAAFRVNILAGDRPLLPFAYRDRSCTLVVMSQSPKLPSIDPHPRNPSPSDDALMIPDFTRYANTAQGLLAQRDLHALRRFVLDASDSKVQSQRQLELQEFSTQDLVLWPNQPNSSACSDRPMYVGLYAWPVVVCMQENLSVRNRFLFDDAGSRPMKAAMAQAWAQALGVPNEHVVLGAAITPQLVAGASPLAWQSFTKSSYKRVYAGMQFRVGNKPKDWDLLAENDHASDVWSHLVPPGASSSGVVGPYQPMAYLLTALVLWDVHAMQPVVKDPGRTWSRRMESLLQASFMHSKPLPTAKRNDQRRVVIHSDIRAGQPQRLHRAVTQAQWMQLAWMAERARKSGYLYRMGVETHGSVVQWNAATLDDEQDECATIEYAYEGFWRPADHIQTIVDRVDLAQGTGLMDGRP